MVRVIYSVFTCKDMNNHVTLEANMKYVLIKQSEVVHNEECDCVLPAVPFIKQLSNSLLEKPNRFFVRHQQRNAFL